MRSGLDHLPHAKQRELEHVVRVLFEEFDAAHAMGTKKWKKQGRIFKILLYGSYARGDWVDDPIGGYKSDYDILIVVNDERLTDFEFWSAADDRLMRDVTIHKTLSAPVNFIAHSLTDTNNQLERGRPFFIDIADQGVALYEAEGFPFSSSRKLPEADAKAEAQKNFDRWFESAGRRAELARGALEKNYLNEAAFDFHQAAERFYHCTLLVLCLYSPKSHRLNFLRDLAEGIAPDLVKVWPRSDKFSRRCFELLREAYVNARYSPRYSVTAEELAWIGERVAVLEDLVRKTCEDRLSI